MNYGHERTLATSASAPKALDKSLEASHEAVAAEREGSACSMREVGETQMKQEDAHSA